MSISPTEPINLKSDADAMFVLVISVVIMLASCGLSYLLILFWVLKTAKLAEIFFESRSAAYLVFGKRLVNNFPDADFRSRLNRLMVCRVRVAIIMGGKTREGIATEALAGLDYLRSQGCGISDIKLEQKSSSTLDNLRNARLLLDQKPAIIISNRYHLARCGALAASLSIPYQLCAAENVFNVDADNLLKCLLEAFYLHWFYTGKYWAKLIQSQRMLDRIS